MLMGERITLSGDIVNLNEIAKARGVSVESVRMALHNFEAEGYVRVGNLFVSEAKLDQIDQKLAGVKKLTDALQIMEASDLKDEAHRVLEALGYTSTSGPKRPNTCSIWSLNCGEPIAVATFRFLNQGLVGLTKTCKLSC
jgi:DNA-binding transcriptional regulator YhcF (GntR family)